jgi:hypothetical protein
MQFGSRTRNRDAVRPNTGRCRHVAGTDSHESDMFIRKFTLLTLIAITLIQSADARAQSEPSFSSRPVSPTGRYYRVGFGVSVLPARIVATEDDTNGRIVATSGTILISAGRRFRGLNALHADLTVDIGPSPRVTEDGETSSFEDLVFKRYMLGVGLTRFIRDAEGPSITFGVGPAVAILDDDDQDDPLTVFFGVGAYASLGAGREWRVRNIHLGLLGLVRAELYRGLDTGERVRGASMSLLFTVSRSQLVD